MRIAYLSLHWPRPVTSGVGKKMFEQLNIWREHGHEVCFFSHRHSYPRPEELIAGVDAEYRLYLGKIGKIRTELARIGAMRIILEKIKAYRPDIIYLRSAIYIYPLHRLFAIAPVVIEINTNEDSQHRLLGRLYYTYYRFTRSLLLNHAAGVVTISQQIANAQWLKTSSAPVRAILNGFDFSSVLPLVAPNNNTPRLVFIGSPGNPWHAVEKLVDLARTCPDICIDVIGYDRLNMNGPLPANLRLHGYLGAEDYRRILAQADAAIGSVGLHRIDMHEGSPLKIRECLAYGLPMILPYVDTDLKDLPVDWLLTIPNQEDNILSSVPIIHDFLFRMRGIRADRDLLMPRLDARVKERQRLLFFHEILGRGK